MLEPGNSNAGILVLAIGLLALFSIGFVLYATSGWQHLRAKYKAPKFPKSAQSHWLMCKVGMLNMDLVSTANEKGIYLRGSFIFSLFFRPVYIPWEDIHNIHPTEPGSFFMPFSEAGRTSKKEKLLNHITFDIGGPSIATISLNKKAFDGSPLENEIRKGG